jgi:hypothetical protein
MTAPSEDHAIEALKKVQALSGAELDGLIDAEIGNSMLGVFQAIATAMFPEDPKGLSKRVHLMVLAYLLRCEVEG